MRYTMVDGPIPICRSDGTCFATYRAAHTVIGSQGGAQGFRAAHPKLLAVSSLVLGAAPRVSVQLTPNCSQVSS